MTVTAADVLVVGGGPSGLAAAIAMRRLNLGRVIVVDREGSMGGIPRHSNHVGYGIQDLHRPLTGPQYARRYVRDAIAAGADLLTETSVVDWAGARVASISSPGGLTGIEAGAIVLATGCRERPRSARLIPGTRPRGVFTTGSLQQFVYLHGRNVGRRAVVVGAEHVSFSALLTLAHAGVKTIALVTEQPRHQTYAALALVTARRLGVPILCGQTVAGIEGRTRVEGVRLMDLATGAPRDIACDTVVFTGDWIPENELVRTAGLSMDPGTNGPRVDAELRTSGMGVFAIGNLLHGAETSDVAAAEGRRVATSVQAWLATGRWAPEAAVPLHVAGPLAWVTPNVIHPSDPGASRMAPLGHFTLRSRRFVEKPVIEVRQADRLLWAGRPRSGLLASFLPALPGALQHGPMIPGRPVHLTADWVRLVRAEAGDVVIGASTSGEGEA